MENNIEKHKRYAYLCPLRFGIAAGIFVGLLAFILTLIAAHSNYANEWSKVVGSIWPGYEVSNKGAFIGLLYGFLQGFITFGAIATIYDCLLCCTRCKDESSCCKK